MFTTVQRTKAEFSLNCLLMLTWKKHTHTHPPTQDCFVKSNVFPAFFFPLDAYHQPIYSPGKEKALLEAGKLSPERIGGSVPAI